LHYSFYNSVNDTDAWGDCLTQDHVKAVLVEKMGPRVLLRRELHSVISEVADLESWFLKKGALLKHVDGETDDDKQRGKRLLQLFVLDLMVGINGQIVSNKLKRDFAEVEPVSIPSKVVATGLVGSSILGMLLYIYLFAMQQSESCQQAWLNSFFIWLVFDVTLASTGCVLITHVLIPMFALTDIAKVKKKVLTDILRYKQEIDHNIASGHSAFNSAKYLFVSHRVAARFPDIPGSADILNYSTQWPKSSLKSEKQTVSRSYDLRFSFLFGSINQIVLFSLTRLFTLPPTLQDVLLQLISTTSLGYLYMHWLRLFAISPILATLPVLVLAVIIYVMTRGGAINEKLKHSGELYPVLDTIPKPVASNSNEDCDGPLHMMALLPSSTEKLISRSERLTQARRLSLQLARGLDSGVNLEQKISPHIRADSEDDIGVRECLSSEEGKSEEYRSESVEDSIIWDSDTNGDMMEGDAIRQGMMWDDNSNDSDSGDNTSSNHYDVNTMFMRLADKSTAQCRSNCVSLSDGRHWADEDSSEEEEEESTLSSEIPPDDSLLLSQSLSHTREGSMQHIHNLLIESTSESESGDIESTSEADSGDTKSTSESDSGDIESTSESDSGDIESTSESDSGADCDIDGE
jgi:hypothetical protein